MMATHHRPHDQYLQQKIDHEIKMRDGTAKLLAVSKNPQQMLEASKNLLTSNTKMIAYMTELQRRKTEEVMSKDKVAEHDKKPCKAKAAFSDIRIPLMWKDSDHFKGKGDHKKYAVFCLVKIGTEILDTALVKDVDRSMTDISFSEVMVFKDIDHDFECTLEIYCHKQSEDVTHASTPRKLKKKLNEISHTVSRNVGKRLSGLRDDKDLMGNTLVGPKFERIAVGSTKLDDVSDMISTYALTIDNFDPEVTGIELPLFGNFCGRLVVQPDCLLHSAAKGYLHVKQADSKEWKKYFCELGNAKLSCYNNEEDANSKCSLCLFIPVNHKESTVKNVTSKRSGKDHSLELTVSSIRKIQKHVLAAEDEDSFRTWLGALQQHLLDHSKWGECCDYLMDIKTETPRKLSSTFMEGGRRSHSLYDDMEVDSPMTRILNRLNVDEMGSVPEDEVDESKDEVPSSASSSTSNLPPSCTILTDDFFRPSKSQDEEDDSDLASDHIYAEIPEIQIPAKDSSSGVIIRQKRKADSPHVSEIDTKAPSVETKVDGSRNSGEIKKIVNLTDEAKILLARVSRTSREIKAPESQSSETSASETSLYEDAQSSQERDESKNVSTSDNLDKLPTAVTKSEPAISSIDTSAESSKSATEPTKESGADKTLTGETINKDKSDSATKISALVDPDLTPSDSAAHNTSVSSDRGYNTLPPKMNRQLTYEDHAELLLEGLGSADPNASYTNFDDSPTNESNSWPLKKRSDIDTKDARSNSKDSSKSASDLPRGAKSSKENTPTTESAKPDNVGKNSTNVPLVKSDSNNINDAKNMAGISKETNSSPPIAKLDRANSYSDESDTTESENRNVESDVIESEDESIMDLQMEPLKKGEGLATPVEVSAESAGIFIDKYIIDPSKKSASVENLLEESKIDSTPVGTESKVDSIAVDTELMGDSIVDKTESKVNETPVETESKIDSKPVETKSKVNSKAIETEPKVDAKPVETEPKVGSKSIESESNVKNEKVKSSETVDTVKCKPDNVEIAEKCLSANPVVESEKVASEKESKKNGEAEKVETNENIETKKVIENANNDSDKTKNPDKISEIENAENNGKTNKSEIDKDILVTKSDTNKVIETQKGESGEKGKVEPDKKLESDNKDTPDKNGKVTKEAAPMFGIAKIVETEVCETEMVKTGNVVDDLLMENVSKFASSFTESTDTNESKIDSEKAEDKKEIKQGNAGKENAVETGKVVEQETVVETETVSEADNAVNKETSVGTTKVVNTENVVEPEKPIESDKTVKTKKTVETKKVEETKQSVETEKPEAGANVETRDAAVVDNDSVCEDDDDEDETDLTFGDEDMESFLVDSEDENEDNEIAQDKSIPVGNVTYIASTEDNEIPETTVVKGCTGATPGSSNKKKNKKRNRKRNKKMKRGGSYEVNPQNEKESVDCEALKSDSACAEVVFVEDKKDESNIETEKVETYKKIDTEKSSADSAQIDNNEKCANEDKLGNEENKNNSASGKTSPEMGGKISPVTTDTQVLVSRNSQDEADVMYGSSVSLNSETETKESAAGKESETAAGLTLKGSEQSTSHSQERRHSETSV